MLIVGYKGKRGKERNRGGETVRVKPYALRGIGLA